MDGALAAYRRVAGAPPEPHAELVTTRLIGIAHAALDTLAETYYGPDYGPERTYKLAMLLPAARDGEAARILLRRAEASGHPGYAFAARSKLAGL